VIAHLQGKILRKAPQELVLDVAGVGYRVTIPLSTFYRLGEPGDEVNVLTHTHVREDTFALFGFLTSSEQALFERLISVAGVGPRLAIGILSGIEAPDLVGALRSGDVARLTRIPGVGKKTAERLVVELKDKMEGLAGASRLCPGAPRLLAERGPAGGREGPQGRWRRPLRGDPPPDPPDPLGTIS
jgi:Holliday junction DNA helicase RuvA